MWGRALESAPVLGTSGEVVRRLYPDEVLPISPAGAAWYRVSGGRVQRASLQPIGAIATKSPAPEIGDVAQVVAPYAVVRAWCAPDAPQKARVGWGGTALVEDRLSADGEDWLGLRFPEMPVLLWSPAQTWRASGIHSAAGSTALRIDRQARQAELIEADRVAWTTPVALPADLRPGQYALTGRSSVAQRAATGAPWELDFGAWRLHGAYWHNRFGDSGYHTASGVLEVPVLGAQALYAQTLMAAEVV